MLSIALLTLSLLSSLPQPVAATPAIPRATAEAPIAATFVNLLDWLDMGALPSGGLVGVAARSLRLYS
jgi:hypothetical protein